MSDLDFYAHVATRCDVLGAGIDSSPESWRDALGPDGLDVPSRGLLRRDHGLVEINFAQKSEGQRAMSCFGYGVKIHRLFHGDLPAMVPPPLAEAYGSFAQRVRFTELRAAIEALCHTVEIDEQADDMHRYRVPESGARIHVIEDPDPCGNCSHDPDDPDDRQAGDVWSIDVSPMWSGRP